MIQLAFLDPISQTRTLFCWVKEDAWFQIQMVQNDEPLDKMFEFTAWWGPEQTTENRMRHRMPYGKRIYRQHFEPSDVLKDLV